MTEQFYLINEEGYFIGDSLTRTENTVDVRPPQPCWKPRWDFDQELWIEEDQESLNRYLNPPATLEEPTEFLTQEERIAQLEEKIAQLTELLERA